MNTFQELKLAIKLQPIFRREAKLMKMKLTTSTFCQILLGFCDCLNILLPITSGQTKVYIGAALGILHILVNTIAHLSNPDGTAAVDADYVQSRTVVAAKDAKDAAALDLAQAKSANVKSHE